MRKRATLLALSALATAALVSAALGLESVALAQRTHTVRAGQSVSRIARRYGVTVSDLLSANGLDRDDPIRPGMELVIPEDGVVYVRAGQTLSEIARAHGCSVEELRRLNRLDESSSLRVGDRLVLCGFDDLASASGRRRSGGGGSGDEDSRWGAPRTRGVATFYRVSTRVTSRVRLVDRTGHPTKRTIRRFVEVLRPAGMRSGRSIPNPPARFVELVAQISNHFGGRRITVVSGYRTAGGDTLESSRHTKSSAIDIRISGVPNTALRDYARTLPRVGVGFYPRSHFVHVDVRDRRAYWVDWSRPGESPHYMRRGDAPPSDATSAELAAVGEGGDDEGEGEGVAAAAEAAGDTGSDAPEVEPEPSEDDEAGDGASAVGG